MPILNISNTDICSLCMAAKLKHYEAVLIQD
jgi:hypothetical protein